MRIIKNSVCFLLRVFLTVILSFNCFSAFAQSIYSIKLRVLDAKTSEPVAFATASVTPKGEKVASKYILTDDNGQATLTKLKKGTYVLKIELMGYKNYIKEVVVEKNVDLGTLKMAEDVEQLDAASVSAVGNPIIVKKDTIEYNASSFKTSDNDMLEELLKKLPGVEVEADGSITANGETIKKITIDGKTFFLDDPQLASRNIPAKIIEKVKVVEKKSDQALFTGIDDGEEETIIDLTVRPGMMRGWFGNIMGGGGHDVPGVGSDMNDPRYQGAAMIGRFTDKSQVSIILNGNNTNNRGFNDMAGSMMQNMRGGGGMGRGMGGWGGNNGISTSWMGGLNGAFTLCDGDMDLAANYLYNGSDKYVEEESYKITYMEDGSHLLSRTNEVGTTFTQGHRFGVRLDHKFSENTSILFEPQFNFGAGHYSDHSDFYTDTAFKGDTTRTNKGFTDNRGDNKNWSTSGFLLFRQKLGKKGRTISANLRYSFSNNELLGYNQSLKWVDENKDGKFDADPDVVNQRIDQLSKSTSLSGRIVYTEPLTDVLFLEANYQYSWNVNQSRKYAYNSGNLGSIIPDDANYLVYEYDGQTLDDVYSNDILNRSINQTAGVNISYQKDKFRAQLGASANPTDTYNKTNGETYRNNVVNWSPQAMLNYEFNDNSNIRMFYFGRSAQPSTSQLMPVPDNSNPNNVSFGNPYLEPYFNHNMRAMFGYTNKKTFTSVNARFGGSFVQNAITSAQWYENGARYSIPVNGPGNGSFDGRIMVNSPLGKSGFSIFSMTFTRFNHSTSYTCTNGFETDLYYDAANADFNYDLFHEHYPDLEKSDKFATNKSQTVNFTQRLRLTYRNDLVELTVGGRTRMTKSWYTIASSGQNANQNATWNNQAEGSMNWTIPGGINLIADVDYNWYYGYTTPQTSEVILNAEITKLLFKNKCTLAVKAYDILGQSKNLSVTDSADSHQEVRNNTLGRYVILSLTYRFGNFNGAGQRRGGPGGGPMGGRPPMGGPHF